LVDVDVGSAHVLSGPRAGVAFGSAQANLAFDGASANITRSVEELEDLAVSLQRSVRQLTDKLTVVRRLTDSLTADSR
jgi:hypothetical protein